MQIKDLMQKHYCSVKDFISWMSVEFVAIAV